MSAMSTLDIEHQNLRRIIAHYWNGTPVNVPALMTRMVEDDRTIEHKVWCWAHQYCERYTEFGDTIRKTVPYDECPYCGECDWRGVDLDSMCDGAYVTARDGVPNEPMEYDPAATIKALNEHSSLR